VFRRNRCITTARGAARDARYVRQWRLGKSPAGLYSTGGVAAAQPLPACRSPPSATNFPHLGARHARTIV
jgi:hypothetical protein